MMTGAKITDGCRAFDWTAIYAGRRLRGWRGCSLVLALSFVAGAASAQTAGVPDPRGTDAGEQTHARTPFACTAGDTQGVPAADVRTAVDMACHELERASGGAGSYRVSLQPLGKSIVLTVARAGSVPADLRTLRLESIEEVPMAAVRVAEALVHGVPVTATQRVDNLVEDERGDELRSKKGSVKPTLGILGQGTLGHHATGGAGFALGLSYVTPSFEIPGELRYTHKSAGNEAGASVFSLSTGMRYFFSKRDVSPYVGGGLSMLSLSVSDAWSADYESSFSGSSFGVAPYVEGGVQLLRLHRARLSAGARIDLPLGSIRSDIDSMWDPKLKEFVAIPAQTRYVAPVTFGLTVSF